MSKLLRRIEISCVDVDGKAAVLFYDLVNEVVMDDPTDFIWSLSDDEQLDAKTVSDAAFSVRRFLESLAGKPLGECRDADIKRFRDEELRSVMSSSRAKQTERVAKNTVNVRVRLAYRLLTWLQEKGRTSERSIGGSGCRVRSTLPDDQRTAGRAQSPWEASTGSARQRARYPLAYRSVGSGSKHSTKFTPSDEVRVAAISALHETASSDYLAHRNALIVDIADTVGWRRQSINSITRGQVAEALEMARGADYVAISPPAQKFGYVETFDVPAWLVERISHFSSDYLEPMAKEKGWKLSPKSKFFLGVNGRPLEDRSITKIVSKAMRAAGAPRFTAVHSLRRKFANDEIADETKYRVNAGLDTTAASIAASVSISLGQHDPDSIYPYVSRSLSAGRIDSDSKRREHVASLEQRVLELTAQVKSLQINANGPTKVVDKRPASKRSAKRK